MLKEKKLPEILAPAGSRSSFLAAIAGGADAIYCGLKTFSARMTADNFSVPELASLKQMAHEKNIKLYIAFNTSLKNSNLKQAFRQIDLAVKYISPDALIIQDLAARDLAIRAGYTGEFHYSTLANISFQSGLKTMKSCFGASRIVLPRELYLNEIKMMSRTDGAPDLEVFIHGALCYAVSGRCYWSSILGGKSGLRGRCVQPCRRSYAQGDKKEKFFSCMDFGLAQDVKSLLEIEKVRAWKIEGRKKGAHYVYNTTRGYRLLRDSYENIEAVKEAMGLLNSSFGRKTTKYFFGAKGEANTVATSDESASGLLVGKINNEKKNIYFTARENLFPGDMIRIGFEDEPGHLVQKIKTVTEKNSRVDIEIKDDIAIKGGTPVYLIDRRNDILVSMLSDLEKEFEQKEKIKAVENIREFELLSVAKRKIHQSGLVISRDMELEHDALWLSYEVIKKLKDHEIKKTWWVLPPVIWPKDEKNYISLCAMAVEKGAGNFILNSIPQISFFPNIEKMNIWAGPFCNISNSISAGILQENGFSGAIVCPEIGGNDYLEFPSLTTLPLGVIVKANWPVAISRALPGDLSLNKNFSSMMKEEFWSQPIDGNIWVFPNWMYDISGKIDQLSNAGYSLFVTMLEKIPEGIELKKRKGIWNWEHGLM